MLEIKSLSKSIGGKLLFSGLDLNVARGQVAVLLGPSGTGKSTLLRILNNLDSADSGTVNLDGRVLDLARVSIDHTVGLVFQNFNLFEHLSVEDNIALALQEVQGKSRSQALAVAHDLLAQYRLLHKKEQGIGALSGGERQRVALARTLAVKPLIVCLDEPTSALDPMLSAYIAQIVYALAQQGHIVIVATHDMGFLEKLPCTIHLLRDGAIAVSVGSAEFFAQRERYTALALFVGGQPGS